MFRTAFVSVQLTLVTLVVVSGCKNTVTSPAAESKQDRETWDVYRMQGKRIGYAHTTIASVRDDAIGGNVVRIERLDHLAVKRDGQSTEQDIRTVSYETPEGMLIRFESEMHMGPSPIRTEGQVQGGRLVMKTSTAAATSPAPSSVAWPADGMGPLANEQTLRLDPMKPGQRRTLTMLMIGLNQPCKLTMEAKDYEPAELLGGKPVDLLRIETVTHLSGGQSIAGTVWVDRNGEILKTSSETMHLESYRVSAAEALNSADADELDLLGNTMVKLAQPLKNASKTQKVRYRIRLKQEDPAEVFVQGSSQNVVPIDPHTAEVTVEAIRPGREDGNRDAPADPPTDDDRRPNDYIQSDDPLIVAQANEAAGDATDPWRITVALESYVHRKVTNKNYSQAFATASEVAKSLEGDCTEHAVYLAALARARGIPARVAVGLVYMEPHQAFGYHMWTEVYVDSRWIPLDGTMALGGIGADHLKIGQTNLHGTSMYSEFLPVMQILGQLEIDVLDAQ